MCYQVPPFCAGLNAQGNCAACVATHFLKDGQCVLRPVLANCDRASALNPEQCELCSEGFRVAQGACQLIVIPNCAAYRLGTNQCLECLAGFFLRDNRCASVSPHCAGGKYDPSNGRCL